MQTKSKPFHIQELLPDQFIYDLGLYLQTCAHIELVTCDLICAIEGYPDRNLPNSKRRFHELRKLNTKHLIKKLRSMAENVTAVEGIDFLELVEWIDKYQIYRHIAVHGAFIDRTKSGVIEVLYTHHKKDHGEKLYFPEEAKIGPKVVRELIADGDRILKKLAALSEKIRSESD